MTRLEGRTIIITGAAQGQGAAEARACVAEGATVVATDVDDDLGAALAAEIGATYLHLDVADDDQWAHVVDEATGRHGHIHGLVNNAGIFAAQTIADGDLETTRRIWEVNQLGTWTGMRRVVPSMTAAGGGSIVNISSIAAMGGYPAAAYGASKWAVRGMTKRCSIVPCSRSRISAAPVSRIAIMVTLSIISMTLVNQELVRLGLKA